MSQGLQAGRDLAAGTAPGRLCLLPCGPVKALGYGVVLYQGCRTQLNRCRPHTPHSPPGTAPVGPHCLGYGVRIPTCPSAAEGQPSARQNPHTRTNSSRLCILTKVLCPGTSAFLTLKWAHQQLLIAFSMAFCREARAIDGRFFPASPAILTASFSLPLQARGAQAALLCYQSGCDIGLADMLVQDGVYGEAFCLHCCGNDTRFWIKKKQSLALWLFTDWCVTSDQLFPFS